MDDPTLYGLTNDAERVRYLNSHRGCIEGVFSYADLTAKLAAMERGLAQMKHTNQRKGVPPTKKAQNYAMLKEWTSTNGKLCFAATKWLLGELGKQPWGTRVALAITDPGEGKPDELIDFHWLPPLVMDRVTRCMTEYYETQKAASEIPIDEAD